MSDQTAGQKGAGIARLMPTWLALTLATLGAALLIGASLGGPVYHATLANDAMGLNGGYAVNTPMPPRSDTFFVLREDSGESNASELVLFENGQPLGPAHTSHDDIRTLGEGRYSHWAGHLFLSASDNSDARENGRVYTVQSPTHWPTWIWVVGGLLLAIGVSRLLVGLARR